MDLKAVLWDLGGVLVRTQDWSPRQAWERRLGLPEGGLSELVFRGEVGRLAAIGRASAADIWRAIADRFDLNEGEKAQIEADFWRGDEVDEQLIAFIRSLRPRAATGLISNAWPDLRAAIEGRWGIADAFDVIVISAEAGVTKPDARLYRLALDQLHIGPEQAIFIDDFEENVEAARKLGMQAILFVDAHQAMDRVRRLMSR